MATLRRTRASITRRSVLPAVTAALAAASIAPTALAQANQPATVVSKRLWATVNVCDTADHPDTIGIRASMPGSARRGVRLFMRYRLQYLGSSDNAWHHLDEGGDSGFVDVGSGRYRRREAGRNFMLDAPTAGREYVLRGLVTFEWRRGDHVLRRARKRTTAGHVVTAGADPKGFSAATCTIR